MKIVTEASSVWQDCHCSAMSEKTSIRAQLMHNPLSDICDISVNCVLAFGISNCHELMEVLFDAVSGQVCPSSCAASCVKVAKVVPIIRGGFCLVTRSSIECDAVFDCT